MPQILCKHFVTCRLCGSRDRRCSCAALHHVVSAVCARDRILTAVCHIPDGRTVFSFQSASVAIRITPPYINPTTRVQKTTKFFVNSFSFLYEVLTCAPDISTSIAMSLTVHWVFFCELFDVFVRIHIFFTIHLYNRRNKKAPHKIELRQRIVLTRFRTALGRFSVLTDPALLARIDID